jgi:hypothetical protein
MLDPNKARFPEAVLFCADCNRGFGRARKGTLGFYFTCPDQKECEPPHLARVILDQRSAKWWLARERQFLTFQKQLSPFMALRKILSKMEAGSYLLFSTAFLCIAIAGWNLLLMWQSVLACVLAGILVALVSWRFIDIFVTNVSITFTSRFPANPVRSVLFSFVAYVQVALCFAFWYLVLGRMQGQFGETVTPIAAVFYSFATIATVGYGDLKPLRAGAKLLVASELVLGLFFVAIVIAQVAGWATTSRREAGEYPVSDLKQPDGDAET